MDVSGDSAVTVPGLTNVGNNGKIAEDIGQVLTRHFAAQTYRMASQENSVVSMVLAAAGNLETFKCLNCPREKWKNLLGHARGRYRKSIIKSQRTRSVGTS